MPSRSLARYCICLGFMAVEIRVIYSFLTIQKFSDKYNNVKRRWLPLYCTSVSSDRCRYRTVLYKYRFHHIRLKYFHGVLVLWFLSKLFCLGWIYILEKLATVPYAQNSDERSVNNKDYTTVLAVTLTIICLLVLAIVVGVVWFVISRRWVCGMWHVLVTYNKDTSCYIVQHGHPWQHFVIPKTKLSELFVYDNICV